MLCIDTKNQHIVLIFSIFYTMDNISAQIRWIKSKCASWYIFWFFWNINCIPDLISISEISFKLSFQKIHRIQKVPNQNSLSVKLQTFVCSFPIWALISINPNEILLPAA